MVWLGLIKTCFDKKNIPSLSNMFTFCCPMKLIKTYNIKDPMKGLSIASFPFLLSLSYSYLGFKFSSSSNFNRGPNHIQQNSKLVQLAFSRKISYGLSNGIVTYIKVWWIVYRWFHLLQFHKSRLRRIRKKKLIFNLLYFQWNVLILIPKTIYRGVNT